MEYSPSGDLAFEGLTWTLVPSLVRPAATQGSSPARLRGVLRSGLYGVRILIQTSSSRERAKSLAVEFDLRDLRDYNSDTKVLAFLQSPGFESSSAGCETDSLVDVHGFSVVPAKRLGFLAEGNGVADEARLFRILTVLTWGRHDIPYEDIATFKGIFLKESGDLVIYLQLIATREVVGVHLPIIGGNGRPVVSSAAIPHELASLARYRFEGLSRLPSPDEYCSWSVDMSEWIGS